MYDAHSLIKLQNRPALEGEELIAHRFRSGMIAMVSRSDFDRCLRSEQSADEPLIDSNPAQSLWQSIKQFLIEFLSYYGFIETYPASLEGEPGPVVAIPSEALLRVFGISSEWQEHYHLGTFADALFVESSPTSGASRDALCFGNGVIVPVQMLREGQRLRVLRRSWAESFEPGPELVHERA